MSDDAQAIEASELRSWEASAPYYADVLGFATALGGQFELAVELGDITSASRVLDAGCGPGQLTALLDDVAGAVTGIDFAPAMIKEAQNLYPHIDFRVANVEHLPFDEASFDVAVCSYVAHHLARPAAAFEALRRILAPGGRLVVIAPLQEGQVSLGILMQALGEALPDQERGALFPSGPLDGATDPRAYARLLEQVGFTEVAGEHRLKPLVQPDLTTLCDAVWHLAALADQPETLQRQIRSRIQELARPFRRRGGRYSFPDRVITCAGVRPA